MPAIIKDTYLMHFNPYHDKLGRFARSGVGSSSSRPEAMATFGRYKRKNASSKEMYKTGKRMYKDYLKSNEESNGFRPKRNVENRKKVAEKVRKELANDKKYVEAKKNYDNALKAYDKATDDMDRYYNDPSVDWDDPKNDKKISTVERNLNAAEKRLDSAADKRVSERNRIADRFLNEYADAMVKDLDLSKTQEAKEYIIRNSPDNWMDDHIPGSYSSFLYDATERQKEKHSRSR